MKCQEVIKDKLKERIEEFKEALKSEENLVEWLNDNALALTKTTVYRLDLSWGGPQDFIEFEYDYDNQILVRITYYYLDWFDGAKIDIKEGTEEWEILEEIFHSCILVE